MFSLSFDNVDLLTICTVRGNVIRPSLNVPVPAIIASSGTSLTGALVSPFWLLDSDCQGLPTLRAVNIYVEMTLFCKALCYCFLFYLSLLPMDGWNVFMSFQATQASPLPPLPPHTDTLFFTRWKLRRNVWEILKQHQKKKSIVFPLARSVRQIFLSVAAVHIKWRTRNNDKPSKQANTSWRSWPRKH